MWRCLALRGLLGFRCGRWCFDWGRSVLEQGFEIPVDAWLRGPLQEVFATTVLSPRARVADLIDQPNVRRLYRRHLAKVGCHGNVLWSVLVLAKWAEEYMTSHASHARSEALAV